MLRLINKFFLTMVAIVFVSGCAIPKLDPSKPVERRSTPFGDTYRQNDQMIDVVDLGERLASHPASKDKMPNYRTYHTVGMVLSVAGGALIGWPVGISSAGGKPNWDMAYIGGGLAAVGIVFGVLAQNELAAGADAYNGSFGSKKSSLNWQPLFSANSSGPVCGVALRY